MSKLTKTLIIESPTHGTFKVLYDAEDEDKINKHNWSVNKDDHRFYVVTSMPHPDGGITRTGRRRQATLKMHRLVADTPKGMVTDHINGDGLDNRKQNLRICTNAENSRNRGKSKTSTSGYKGVYWNKRDKLWYVHIGHNKKLLYLGCFKDKKEAAKAYDRKAIELHGEFAKFNFPIEDYQ